MPDTPLRWIYFDLGWTLVDEEAALRSRFACVAALARTWGLDLEPGALRDAMEDANHRFAPRPFGAALEAVGLDTERIREIDRHCPFPVDLEHLRDGVEDVLDSLGRDHRLGVIANQSPGTEGRLVGFGIRHHFDAVFASAELGIKKPDPEIFRLAAEAAGCAPVEIAMVGDRLDCDIGPAKRAGWRTVRVRLGPSRTQEPRDECERPDATVEDIRDVPASLARLLD